MILVVLTTDLCVTRCFQLTKDQLLVLHTVYKGIAFTGLSVVGSCEVIVSLGLFKGSEFNLADHYTRTFRLYNLK